MMIGLSLQLGHLITIAIALLGAYYGLIKLIVKQFNDSLAEKFKTAEATRTTENSAISERIKTENSAISERIKKLEEGKTKLEEGKAELAKELAALQLELVKDYCRREDSIRNESVTQAKLDGLARRLDEFLNRKQ